MARYGMGFAEYVLLSACQEEGETTVSQLTRRMPVDASRISRIVTDLVDAGLVRRRRLRHDRRVVMLSLTPRGQELVADATKRLQDYYVELTEGISKRDMQSFAATAREIAANFEAE